MMLGTATSIIIVSLGTLVLSQLIASIYTSYKMHQAYKPNLFHDVPLRGEKVGMNVVIESREGNGYEYKYNSTTKEFELYRDLPSDLYLPAYIGFFPKTYGTSLKPMQGIVYCEDNLFTGDVATVHVLGMIEIEVKGKTDRKIICLCKSDPRIKKVKKQPLKVIDRDGLRKFYTRYIKDMEKAKVDKISFARRFWGMRRLRNKSRRYNLLHGAMINDILNK